MPSEKKPANPLYALVVVAGVAFTITACAYGIFMVRSLNPVAAESVATSGLLSFMDRHGFQLLLGELAVLGVATVAAILTDDFWARRGSR